MGVHVQLIIWKGKKFGVLIWQDYIGWVSAKIVKKGWGFRRVFVVTCQKKGEKKDHCTRRPLKPSKTSAQTAVLLLHQ